MIAIVDYDVGNRGSIANMLRKLGCDSAVTRDPDAIRRARKLILPGIGAFDQGMEKLAEHNLIDLLNEQVLERRVPILGICLGMQLFGTGSDEGTRTGFGWIQARSVRFAPSAETRLKVPHMGWNSVTPAEPYSADLGITETARYYFVHSYHVVCRNQEDVLATCEYGGSFTAAILRDNVFGVQFHPEKSHKFGLEILKRFAESN